MTSICCCKPLNPAWREACNIRSLAAPIGERFAGSGLVFGVHGSYVRGSQMNVLR